MAKYSRMEVAQKMGEQGMVPLFYHADLEVAKQVVAACYNGGARLLEFTNRGDFAHEVFGELNKFCLKELPGMIEAEANRAQARLKLYGNSQNVDQRFNLVSPVAGTIVERNLNPGQELRPDQPAAPQFVVTDPTRLWAQLDAAETDLKLLKPGTAIVVTSNQYPDDSFAGELK